MRKLSPGVGGMDQNIQTPTPHLSTGIFAEREKNVVFTSEAFLCLLEQLDHFVLSQKSECSTQACWEHLQQLVAGRTKADQAVAAQGALPEFSMGFAAGGGGVGMDDPLGKEGRSMAFSPHSRGLHSLGSYSHYRIHPPLLMIHITHSDHLTPSCSLCLRLAQAAISSHSQGLLFITALAGKGSASGAGTGAHGGILGAVLVPGQELQWILKHPFHLRILSYDSVIP